MADSIFEKVYNPDVLSCLANLSNDEVFTPPTVANDMLDLLPQELFSNPDTKFLDPACKSGVFLREIAKRLIKGLEHQFPDLNERIEHIFKNQLYGIAITELTSLISRRSLYCSAYPNSEYSVIKFDNAEGNIRFRRINHTWHDGKCVFCGAAQSQYSRGDELETHAYEFIHFLKPEEIFNMKFDVIISNPPYHLADGGNGASASPIYHQFVTQAMKMKPHYITMIIPARWYAGGKGLDDFREIMLKQDHIKILVDIADSSDCFPGVNVAGGIGYFLWDKTYSGNCNVENMKKGTVISSVTRSLNEFDYFVRSNIAISIIRKIKNISSDMMNKVVYSRNYFGLSTTINTQEKSAENCYKVLSSKGILYTNRSTINDRDKIIEKYKVIVTYAMSGGNKPTSEGNYQVLSSLKVLKPNEVCTETYLIIGVFNSLIESENLVTYMSSKLARFLLLQALTSIHITKDKFCFVPLQDFSKPWTDEELYKKYNLTDEEIAFIESMIKPMDLGGDNNA